MVVVSFADFKCHHSNTDNATPVALKMWTGFNVSSMILGCSDKTLGLQNGFQDNF